jgi:D-alanine-D-alanine ligase
MWIAEGALVIASEKKGRNGLVRTLGPVENLEHHVPADWWRTIFNAYYLKTDGDVVENDENTVKDVDLLLAASGAAQNAAILDLCCGQGRHSLELARRGFTNVVGVDRSASLVGLARRRAKQRGLSVVFQEGDARRVTFPDASFDVAAVMGNSFGYFEDSSDDLELIRGARRILRPGGVIAVDVSDGDWIRANYEPRSWEWIDRNLFVCRERSLSADSSRIVCREVIAHARKGIVQDQFYATRLYSEAALRGLLEEGGFTDIRNHGAIATESERNQDLGLMVRRLFITAR